MAIGKVARSQHQHFLSKEETGVKTRLAKGFSTIDNSITTDEDTTTWVDGVSDTIPTAQTWAWSIDGNIYLGNTANELLADMTRTATLGSESTVYLVNVYTWKPVGSLTDTYEADMYPCTFAPSGYGGGEGSSSAGFSGNLTAKSARIPGTAKITSVPGLAGNDECEFTAD